MTEKIVSERQTRSLSRSHLRQLAERATPGPWKHETHEGGNFGEREYTAGHVTSLHHNYAGNRVSRRDSITSENSMLFADGEYIAAAHPDAIRSLLDDLDRAEQTSDDLGLSIDMLDVDRLKMWADRIETYGDRITEWGSPQFVAEKMRDIASRMEEAIRDIGKLRRSEQGGGS